MMLGMPCLNSASVAESPIPTKFNRLFLSDSEKYYTLDGKIPEGRLFDELSDIYRTKDGYVRLHTNFPQSVFLSRSLGRTHLPWQS